MWIINAKLPQEEDGLIVKAIEEVMRLQNKLLPSTVYLYVSGYSAPQNTEPKQSACAETPSTESANPESKTAESEPSACAETFSTELDTPESEIVETATFAQKRVDALSAIVEHYIASDANESDKGLKSLAGHERCQVVVHLDVETLKQDHHCCEHGHDEVKNEDSSTCQYQTPPNLDKQWISLENAERFSCDASLLTVLEDKDGNILNLGRNTRTVSPTLKRALDIRDETCRFPGCCESRYVDFHHRELHSGHYSIEIRTLDKKRILVFKTSTGGVMEPSPKFPACTVESTVEGYFEQQWPDINSHTGDSRWWGEIMDYGMAVDALLACQEKSVADACV